MLKNTTHRKVYVFFISCLAASISLGKVPMSLSLIGLSINWLLESNFQLNFKTTDSISIDFDGGAGRPTLIKAGANPIQANLTVSEPSAPE